MLKSKIVSNKKFGSSNPIQGEVPKQCPICKEYGSPDNVGSTLSTQINNTLYLIDRYLCQSCEKHYATLSFVCQENSKWLSEIITYHPSSLANSLPDELRDLSSRSDEFYRAAQENFDKGYFDVSGMALRSAAEFLVKDFAVQVLKEPYDAVSKKKLVDAIDCYMKATNLKVPATMIRFYGNDFTHWDTRLNRDELPLIFKFFNLLVDSISMEMKAIEMGALDLSDVK